MVDQRRRVDDQVDGVGQPLPGLLVQAEVGLALVAGDDFQVVGGQLAVVRSSFGSPLSNVLSRRARASWSDLAAHQGDQLAVDQVHPLQPFQRQVAAQETGRAGQQHRAHFAGRPAAGRAQRPALRASMNLSSVRSAACTSTASRPCTAAKRGPLGALSLASM